MFWQYILSLLMNWLTGCILWRTSFCCSFSFTRWWMMKSYRIRTKKEFSEFVVNFIYDYFYFPTQIIRSCSLYLWALLDLFWTFFIQAALVGAVLEEEQEKLPPFLQQLCKKWFHKISLSSIIIITSPGLHSFIYFVDVRVKL